MDANFIFNLQFNIEKMKISYKEIYQPLNQFKNIRFILIFQHSPQ